MRVIVIFTNGDRKEMSESQFNKLWKDQRMRGRIEEVKTIAPDE